MSIASVYAYRWFGFLSCDRADGLRFTWLQVVPRWGMALELSLTGDDPYWFSLHAALIWGHVYLTLPIRFTGKRVLGGFGPSWGASWPFNDAWHLHWGEWTTIIYMPWRWEWVRTSTLLLDGSWLNEYATWRMANRDPNGVGPRRKWMPPDTRKLLDELDIRANVAAWRMELPYRYERRSGEVQERTATIKVVEREWRRWWTYRVRWGAKVSRVIDVQFDAEVGERSGSWKGGVLGCSWGLLPGELPEHALRRMEKERKL